MRKAVLIAAVMVCPALAEASIIKSVLADAELRGAATFRFVGFPLYDARLYTQDGAPLDWSEDFGLELQYRRNLTAYDLVESTMRELRRTGTPLPVRDQLEQCFEAVQTGDRYAAVSDGPDRLAFWRNDRRGCTGAHPGIKQGFMRIFLGENSRSRSFTRALKGE